MKICRPNGAPLHVPVLIFSVVLCSGVVYWIPAGRDFFPCLLVLSLSVIILTAHSQLSPEELLDQGIKPNTIRLSIGVEHIDGILADLEKGFAAVR